MEYLIWDALTEVGTTVRSGTWVGDAFAGH